ncbi:MAG: hypothetical protein HXY34_11465 [Candidatus Thorarchaeota archaeon]|nr:hypothetical protein [Candidatus Thorarchaeota archaeon]
MTTGGRDESYWMGVRDALRMIDSFIKWSRRNPEKAKTLDDFLNEALIAVSKKCESCLSDLLGVSFGSSGERPEESADRSSSLADSELSFEQETRTEESPTDTAPTRSVEVVPDPAESLDSSSDLSPGPPETSEEVPLARVSEEVPLARADFTHEDTELVDEESGDLLHAGGEDVVDESESESAGLPTPDEPAGTGFGFIRRTDAEHAEELRFEGPPRDFVSEFHLDAPEPYEADESGFAEHEETARRGSTSDEGLESSPEVLPSTDEFHEDTDLSGQEEPSFSESKLPEALDELERAFSSHGITISPEPVEEEPHVSSVSEESAAAPESVDERSGVHPTGLWYDEMVRGHEPREDSTAPEALRSPDEEVSVVEERPSMSSPSRESASLEETKEADHTEAEESAVDEDDFTDRLPSRGTPYPPPPPPPPDEDDESEEERIRRARRLFFGT